MASYEYNYKTGSWDIIKGVDIPADTYIVRELPGDEPQQKEIPAAQAYNPRLLALLGKYRPALAEASPNTSRQRPGDGLSKKRSYDESDDDNDESGPDESPLILTHNCDEIRAKINALVIPTGTMKVVEFTKAINVSGPGYYRFMKQTGPDKGQGCEAYTSAMRFFQKLEKNGVIPTEPIAKKIKLSTSAPSITSASTFPKPPASSVTSRASSAAPTGTPNAGASVQLEGELSDNVPVYDTCDEIRRKINKYLSQPSITQASFLRTLMSQYHTQSKVIQSVQLSRFRGMSGPDAGNTNPVFYAGYVFFEKERVGMGKGKSETRRKMEELYPRGIDVEKGSHRKGFFGVSGDVITQQDQNGQLNVVGRVVKEVGFNDN
ncbi:hypothetical protein EJ08DRAFT_627671 [Tothia fuscella]|uniref:DUF7726 domain-containing protein n=1 Tax=Tothia fuscella TaxID=1048955 RepID=A0A9P4U1T2_9PEZI|nr:hypothetical protein EJ08DRAFT_627671 [Tothia fuscella]